jgi:hypothetical protein
MSEQTAPDVQPESTASNEQATSSPQVPDAVMSRLDELAAGLAKLAPQETSPQHGLTEAVTQFDPFTDETDDYSYEETDPQQQAAEAQQLQQFIAQQVQQAASPFLQQLQQQAIHQQASALEQRYPELAKPEVAGPIVQQAQQVAAQIGRTTGLSPQQVDALWRSPEFVENLYLAQRARTAAAQETPADATSNVQLEGSAAQVEQQGTDDVMSRIANSGPKPGSFRW